jgi:hypothetical protein
VDFNMSSDGGLTYHPGRAPAAVEVLVANLGSSAEDGLFDTEMLQLSITGGDLPAGVMLRESPTLQSQGGTKIQRLSDGTYQINSFFDVFTELSTDGGQNWQGATTGPTSVGLVCNAPEQTEPSNNLPPEQGQYVSPDQWHALFANGIIISNVSHLRFTSSEPPPPPGGSSTHQFGSTVQFQISMNGGQTWSSGSAPANVVTKVLPKIDNFYPNGGSLRYFDTEMLSLNLQGGTLPGNIRLRESPSKASLGRTSIRQSGGGGAGLINPPYHISSFFDVFTEISTDAGNSWSPSLTLPPSMSLLNCTGPANLSITLSSDGTRATISWTGTGFRLQCTEKLEEPAATQWQNIGGLSPVTVDVVPGKSRFYRVLCP